MKKHENILDLEYLGVKTGDIETSIFALDDYSLFASFIGWDGIELIAGSFSSLKEVLAYTGAAEEQLGQKIGSISIQIVPNLEKMQEEGWVRMEKTDNE